MGGFRWWCDGGGLVGCLYTTQKDKFARSGGCVCGGGCGGVGGILPLELRHRDASLLKGGRLYGEKKGGGRGEGGNKRNMGGSTEK